MYPVWNLYVFSVDFFVCIPYVFSVEFVYNQPRLYVDSHDRVIGVAMICEAHSNALSVFTLRPPTNHDIWLGNPPPLLSLGTVDLALPGKTETGSVISMFVDPLIPERIYCVHVGGVDSIVLHFLPFTNQKDEIYNDDTRAPTVLYVLNTCQVESSVSPLCGFVALFDSFGCPWIVGLTSGLL